MNARKWSKRATVVLIVLLLFVAGPVQGQEPEPEKAPGGTAYVLAQPPYTMNYQGYLTDSGGTPLNGTYDLAFELWDALSGGNSEWGPEIKPNTQVTQGIFQVTLGSSIALEPDVFDEALFLAVWVNGTWVSPRQPLRAVPYAFGLVPGAVVEGDPLGTSYGLIVNNTGSYAGDRGLYARGEQYGIYAEESGTGDVGIYSPDFVHARGYKSNADSYLWVPSSLGFTNSSGCTLVKLRCGVWIECSTSGLKILEIPITIPAVLYGQEVRVESVTIYYQLADTGSFVTRTRLSTQTHIGFSSEVETLIDDTTDRTSTSEASYTLTPTGNYTLTASSGPLTLRLEIDHDGDVDHDVTIGAVRLKLGHTD